MASKQAGNAGLKTWKTRKPEKQDLLGSIYLIFFNTSKPIRYLEMTESSGYHFGRAAMTALLIWGFFVLVIDGCNTLIRNYTVNDCWRGAGGPAEADHSEVIACLKKVGLDESQISDSFTEKGFRLERTAP